MIYVDSRILNSEKVKANVWHLLENLFQRVCQKFKCSCKKSGLLTLFHAVIKMVSFCNQFLHKNHHCKTVSDRNDQIRHQKFLKLSATVSRLNKSSNSHFLIDKWHLVEKWEIIFVENTIFLDFPILFSQCISGFHHLFALWITWH